MSCDVPIDLSALIDVDADQLGVTLRRGRETALEGKVSRLGRTLSIRLWFNKTFPRGAAGDSTWTEQMRPDISIEVRCPETTPVVPPIWIHFDAKYRVESIYELLDGRQDSSPAVPAALS